VYKPKAMPTAEMNARLLAGAMIAYRGSLDAIPTDTAGNIPDTSRTHPDWLLEPTTRG
jgi:hypothetical protein